MRRVLPVLLLLISLLTSCSSNEPYTDTRYLMGTQCSLTVYSKSDQKVFDGFFSQLEELDHRISRTYVHSEIHAINEKAGIEEVEVSAETFSLIKRALELSQFTGGAFNPLVGALTDLWAIGTDEARVPSAEEISEVLSYVTPDHIVLDEEEQSVFLTSPQTRLDLGAIGKGYASDVLAGYLRENGVSRAIINLGGNIYCIGSKSRDAKWVIGLQNPDSEYGGYYATVEVEDEAVVTSGAYERFTIDEDGKVYHHIFDPQTGYPSESDLLSATIITPDGTLADALSTAVFVLGSEEGAALVERAGVNAVLLTDSLEIIRL